MRMRTKLPLALLLCQLALLAPPAACLPGELKSAQLEDAPARPAVRKFQTAASVPLSDAAAKGDIEALTALLQSGEHSVDQSAGFGMTALHLAAGRDRADAVALLLAHGAAPNEADARGWTPLHLAASRGAAEAATQLLQGGGNVMLRDAEGNRPSLLAQQEGFSTLARILGNAEATVMNQADAAREARIPVRVRNAHEQLPAATLKAAAEMHYAAGGATQPEGRSGYKRSKLVAARGAAAVDDEAKASLLHSFVPRSEGDQEEAEGGGEGEDEGAWDGQGQGKDNAKGKGKGKGKKKGEAGSGGDIGVAAPGMPETTPGIDKVILPAMVVTAHHKILYHTGADGEKGVAVEPTEHTQEVLGRTPPKIAQTRDMVSEWFNSLGAAKTHAAQFTAGQAEAAEAKRKRKDGEEKAKKENEDEMGGWHGDEDGDEETPDDMNAGDMSAPAAGMAAAGGEQEEEQVGGDGQRKGPRMRTMDELLVIDGKSLHTRPRKSNDTAVKRYVFAKAATVWYTPQNL